MAALQPRCPRPIKTSYKTKNVTVPARILYVTGIANKKLDGERDFYPFANLRKLLYERRSDGAFFRCTLTIAPRRSGHWKGNFAGTSGRVGISVLRLYRGRRPANRNGQPFGGALAAERFNFIADDFLPLYPSHNWQGWEWLSNLARICFAVKQ